jgi:hypothetical protein
MLLSGVREKTDAFMKLGWEYVSNSRPDSLIESRSSVAIDWDDGGNKESEEPPNLPDADEHAPRTATV